MNQDYLWQVAFQLTKAFQLLTEQGWGKVSGAISIVLVKVGGGNLNN